MIEELVPIINNSLLKDTIKAINIRSIQLGKTVQSLNINGSEYTCGTLTVTGISLLPINIDVVKDETVPIGFVKVIFN